MIKSMYLTTRRNFALAAALAAVALIGLMPGTVMADFQEYGFAKNGLTINNPTNAATASQYTVTVYGAGESYNFGGSGGSGSVTVGAHQALFVFQNTAVTASSITDVYFQDGTLLGLASSPTPSTAGVVFDTPAYPGQLPDGTSLNPDFATSSNADWNWPFIHMWSADSDGLFQSSIMSNGVNAANEAVGVLFNLKSGQNYSDVLTALANGFNDPSQVWKSDGSDKPNGLTGLRIGIQTTFALTSRWGGTTYKYESFINTGAVDPTVPVPEPTSLAIAAIGALGLLGARWRKVRRSA